MSSSGGALLSLAARGPQDVFLTGNPDTSYFRQVYRRHTYFAMTDVQQFGKGEIAAGNTTRYTLSRQGDMVSALYLRDTKAGERMRDKIDYVRLLIGGQEIVKMTGQGWGNLPYWDNIMSNTYCKSERSFLIFKEFMPLNFWFCEYWNAALPLCALKYHEVIVEVKWAEDPETDHTFELWAKMIWLGNEEREYFVNAPKLSYLIDQWQNSDPIGQNTRKHMELNFNHPVKTLIVDVEDLFDFIPSKRSKIITLSTNGVEISKLSVDQMRISTYYHCPYGWLRYSKPIIPFALNLGSNQPSGSLNFSRLENVQLSCDDLLKGVWASSTVTAVSTNILTIKNGMGGLEFTN